MLQAIIDCLVKLYECNEMDNVDWEFIWDACKEMLTPDRLELYQKLFQDEEDMQMEWETAVDHPALGVSFLIGQIDDKDLGALDDKENMHNTSAYDWMKKIFFLAYHQFQAHKRFMKENPNEVVHF